MAQIAVGILAFGTGNPERAKKAGASRVSRLLLFGWLAPTLASYEGHL